MIIKIIALIIIILFSMFLGFLLAAVLQNKKEDYEIDIFRELDK